MKEPKLGEVFEFEFVKLKCVEDDGESVPTCFGCYFDSDKGFCDSRFCCIAYWREDKTSVKFIEVDKEKTN